MTRKMLWANIAFCSLATGAMAVCLSRLLWLPALAFGWVFLVGLVNLVFLRPLLVEGYRVGWLRGRQALFASMSEAMQRRMTMPEWIEAELERDGIDFVRLEVEIEED